ncbi:MAG: elongation factor P [Planctomycetes bacterium]|nr:elongation factor P [Planctomycetota bacterium]
MSIKVTEVRKGMVLQQDGELWVVTRYDHITPGNWRAINQIYLRNLRTGSQRQMRMGSSETVEPAYLEKKNCEYLYSDGDGYVFMDQTNFDQFTLQREMVGEQMVFIKENESVIVTFFEERPVTVELPSSVVLEIAEAEAAVKGNSVTNLTKNAKTDTGLELKVPLHIGVGEKVKVSTETGEFLGRAN